MQKLCPTTLPHCLLCSLQYTPAVHVDDVSRTGLSERE